MPAAGEPRSTALLVPGFTGSKEDFIPLLEPLAAAGHRVIALDQRGQFETPGPAEPEAYALAELGLDLLAIAEAVRAEMGRRNRAAGPVHLVGHSFGGLTVREAALACPSAVASVTLLCSGPGPIDGAEAERARTLSGALTVFSLDDIWAYASSTAKAKGEYDGVDPEVVDFLRRRFLGSTHAGLAAMVAHLLETPDRTDCTRAGWPAAVGGLRRGRLHLAAGGAGADGPAPRRAPRGGARSGPFPGRPTTRGDGRAPA